MLVDPAMDKCGRCIGGALAQDKHGDVLAVVILGYAMLEHLMEPLLRWWLCMVMVPLHTQR